MKILFINNKTINCGVYQFGKRIDKILSPRLDFFHYHETSSVEDFFNINNNHNIIIFNYIAAGRSNGPLGWLNQQIIEDLRNSGLKVGVIGHLNNIRFDFDFILSQDASGQPEMGKTYSIFRPLPLDMVENPYLINKRKFGRPKIGSFGFADKTKGFTDLIRQINTELSEAEIRLHITSPNYSDPNGDKTMNLIEECRSIKIKNSINLSITTGFIDDFSLLAFLNENNINIFNYDDNEDGGISSVIDFAISSGVPVAVSRSKMFRHIFEKCSFIDEGLSNILNKQDNFNEFFMQKWSHEAFTNRFLSIMKKINTRL